MNTCPHCGSALLETSVVCPSCRAVVDAGVGATQYPPGAEPSSISPGKSWTVSGPDSLPLNFSLPIIASGTGLMDWAWDLFRDNFMFLVALNVLIFAPVLAITSYVFHAMGWEKGAPNTATAVATLALLGSNALITGSAIYGLVRKMAGMDASLKECIAYGVKKWPRMLMYQAIFWVLIFAGLFALVVPGVILWMMLLLMDHVVAIENSQANPFQRSVALTTGIRMRLLKVTLFAGFVLAVVEGVIQALTRAANAWWGLPLEQLFVGILAEIYLCITLVAYLDARRREVSEQPAAAR
jgi:hypothetical protein